MSAAPKQKKLERMQKAAKLRHMDEMSHAEIAQELGISKNTVDQYFTEDEMNELVRRYTDQDLYELQRVVEQDIHDAENEAKDALAEAKRLADSSRAFRQYAAKRMEVAEKKVKLLHEIGVYDKHRESDTSGESVRFQLNYTEAEEHEKESEVET